MKTKPLPPPPVLDCARVLEYAVLEKSIGYAGRTLLFVDGKELGQVSCLAICEDKKPGVLVFHCDRKWRVLGCSAHRSVAAAKDRAERIYPGISSLWVDAGVSAERAEQYLDKVFATLRCSFCGTRADRVGQLISRNKAKICDRCIEDFHVKLRKASAKK